MRPLFKRVAPKFLTSYANTRHHHSGAVRTGASSKPQETSVKSSQPRTQQDVVSDMNRDLDRQLMEFEMADHHRRKESGVSAVELVGSIGKKSSGGTSSSSVESV